MSLGRLASGAFLATGLAATMCVGTYWTASAMQSDLTDQARTTLTAQHLNATVTLSGRDAYVWADTPTARADAIAVLKTIPGIRIVVVGEGAPPTATRPSAPVAASAARPTPTVGATTPPSTTAMDTASVSAADTVMPTETTAAPSLTTAAVPTTSVPMASPSSTAPSAVAIPAWAAILFDGDSSTLTTASKAEVAQIAEFVVAHPTMTTHLIGYTDTSGTAAGRQALGLSRAHAVEALLVAHGVSASRITVASGGGNDPVASSDTSKGRALNRRVTVTMTQET